MQRQEYLSPSMSDPSRPAYLTRISQHSLHTLPDAPQQQRLNDGGTYEDDDDDAVSTHSSRSDQSLEAAGLVSRLSDEQERAQRHAKYEGGSRLGRAATAAASKSHRLSDEADLEGDDEVDDNDEAAFATNSHGRTSINNDLSAEGMFRDRSSSDRRRSGARRKNTLFRQTWLIAREVSERRPLENYNGSKRADCNDATGTPNLDHLSTQSGLLGRTSHPSCCEWLPIRGST